MMCMVHAGHDTSGASICTGGIVIDVSALKQIIINRKQTDAYIQAGVRFQQLDDTLATYGLSAVSGVCYTVGIAGYTLGGGWGMTSKKYGMGLDNILEMDVALPSGEIVTAKKGGKYDDLFWAMRVSGHVVHRLRAYDMQYRSTAEIETTDVQMQKYIYMVSSHSLGSHSSRPTLSGSLQGAGHQNFGIMTSMRYRVYKLPLVVAVNMTFEGPDTNPELNVQILDTYQRKYLNHGTRDLSFYINYSGNTTTGLIQTIIYAVFQQSGPVAKDEAMRLLKPFIRLGPASVYVQVKPPSWLPNMQVTTRQCYGRYHQILPW